MMTQNYLLPLNKLRFLADALHYTIATKLEFIPGYTCLH